MTVLQVLPELESGGVERGTVEVARALVGAGNKAIVISAGGRMVEELEQLGVRHVHCPVGRKNPLTFLHAITLRRFLLENLVDIIDVRSRLPAWVVYSALKLLPLDKRPVLITSVHGAYSVSRYSAVMMRGDYIVAVSEFIKQYILQNYPWVEDRRITVIPRGVPGERYFPAFRPDAGWTQQWQTAHPELNGKFVITLPGRISDLKGQDDFLFIIKTLIDRGYNIHGLIVGGAGSHKQALLERLKQQSKTLAMQQHVTFLGDRQDLREIMTCSDLVLSLSRKPESFGRTIIEAIALGKPVLAYDHGGASEILAQCFPFGQVLANDPDSMCNKIEKYIKDPTARPGPCPFTLDAMLEQTLQLYQQCVARSQDV